MRTVSFFKGTAGAAMFGRGGVGLGFSWSLIGNFRVLKFHGQLAVSPEGVNTSHDEIISILAPTYLPAPPP